MLQSGLELLHIFLDVEMSDTKIVKSIGKLLSSFID